MSDVLLRGRGADVGSRAPVALVRATGAALAVAVVVVAETLGVFQIVPVSLAMRVAAALVIGALIAPTRAGAWLWALLGVLITVLALVLYTPLVGPLASRFVDRSTNTVGPPSAVLVLSGGVTDDGRLTGQALDRLLTAAFLVRDRAIPDLALSVTVIADDTPETSERDQARLANAIAPGVSLWWVRDVFSTYDEAKTFAALARQRGWTDVVVVTSPLHTRRACATIRATGLRVACQPAEPRDYAPTSLAQPTPRRLAFADVLYETSATILYRARGFIP
jgi:uncharacterized SAM-binding protein YcdF (DUF218 family)